MQMVDSNIVIFIFVCGKIMLYNYFRKLVLQIIVLLLVPGIIVLGILGSYIVLEKKNRKKRQAKEVKE